MILFDIFITFLKIGTFTIGGGYAMIPLIEKEVVYKKKWIEKEDFLDLLALAQSAPGPLAVNISVFIGYKVSGLIGSIFAVLGSIFTAFVVLIIISIYFIGSKNNPIIERAFKGIRPAVVALIASPVIQMSKNIKLNKKTIAIPITAIVLVVLFKVNPIYIIISSIIIGLFYGYIKRRNNI